MTNCQVTPSLATCSPANLKTVFLARPKTRARGNNVETVGEPRAL